METITLEKLTELVIEERQFIFKKDEFLYDYEQLVNSNFLKEEHSQIRVLKSKAFSMELYRQFSRKFNFHINSSFSETINFFIQVGNYFTDAQKFDLEISEQKAGLLNFLIIESNKKFDVCFDELIVLFDGKKDRFIYEFNRAFSENLLNLNIPSNKLFSVLNFLYLQMDSNASYNLDLSTLAKGLEDYCRHNPESAKELLPIFLKEHNRLVTLESAILAGLYNNDKAELLYVRGLMHDSSNLLSLICAIRSFSIEDNDEAIVLLDLVEEIKSEDTHILINMSLLFSGFIRNTSITDRQIKERCFECLHELVLNSASSVKQVTLDAVTYLNGYDDQVYTIVSKLNLDVLDERLTDSVSSLLANLSSCKYFFSFIRDYALINKLTFSGKAFSFPIGRFLSSEGAEFSRHLVKLLIDDSGLVRFVGISILRHIFSAIRRNYQFEIDLLKLPAIEQYKLWVSILHDGFDLENSIPLVLTLRKSSYPFVSTALVYKIEESVENYGSTVNEILLRHLNQNDAPDEELIERIKTKADNFSSLIRAKGKVKELNPYYTQADLVSKYNEDYFNRLNEGFQKTVSENSVLSSFATTVILAKGGGWKLDNRTEISKLSTYGTSFQLPRQYYISPDSFDFENRLWYLKNWTTEFKQWEATISSLESI